jgi:hypothetical protein
MPRPANGPKSLFSRDHDPTACSAAFHNHRPARGARGGWRDTLDGCGAALCTLRNGANFVFAQPHELRGNGNLIVQTFRKTFGGFQRLLNGRRIVTHTAPAIFCFPRSGHSFTGLIQEFGSLVDDAMRISNQNAMDFPLR